MIENPELTRIIIYAKEQRCNRPENMVKPWDSEEEQQQDPKESVSAKASDSAKASPDKTPVGTVAQSADGADKKEKLIVLE
jgi:hypothetical protein